MIGNDVTIVDDPPVPVVYATAKGIRSFDGRHTRLLSAKPSNDLRLTIRLVLMSARLPPVPPMGPEYFT
jgi:hypothetical protein